ncbi:MAG: hypothetical protein RL616_1952, partial [Verrucomicrobiota bacterium]
PGELLAAANKILFPDLTRVDMFITAKVVFINAREGKIISASAGHCPLLFGGEKTPPADEAKNSGMPLGIEPKVFYPQTAHALSPGAAALLFTDGLNEARNSAGELLGENNLQEFLAEAVAQTKDAEGAKDFLLRRLAEFRGSAPLADDQTFVLIRHQS